VGATIIDTQIAIAESLVAKRQHRRIAAVSGYDCSAARLISQADVQMILVGDSAAQVVLGFNSTLPAIMDLMVAITAAEVEEIITGCCEVPVIGCDSGQDCDGQMLIVPDILGLTQRPSPKFARGYGNLADGAVESFSAYNKEVQSGRFPDSGHS